MPFIPEFLGGPNGWMGIIAALILLIAFFWKPAKWLARIIKAASQFAEDWTGTKDRKDNTGAVIEKGRPGIPALLERVRAQVENSHDTVMRDDIDVIREMVDRLDSKLDRHITEADNSVARQDKSIARIAGDVGKLKSKYAPET